MIIPLHLEAVAEAFVRGILISVAVGVPLASFTWAVLRLTGRASSGTRFAVWYSTLVTISLLTLLASVQVGGNRAVFVSGSHSLLTVSSPIAVAVFAFWSIIAAIAFFRIAVGLSRLRKLRQTCRTIDAARLDPMLHETLRELGCSRRTRLCVSEELSVPAAIGFFKPRIILPSWVLEEFSPAQLRPVLMHELAHVRRWDDWTNLVQKVLQAILFFHPAMWWIEKQISVQREMACDDVVLANTGSPRAYAESLLSVAEKSFARRGFSLAQAAVNRMRQTSARISQILDPNRSDTIRTRKPLAFLLAGASVLSFVIAPHLGELVAFQSPVPIVMTVAQPGTSLEPTENSIPIVMANVPTPRRAARPVSFQMKNAFATATNEDPRLPSGKFTEAKFRPGARSPIASQSNNKARNGRSTVQAVFVVTQFQRDGLFPEVYSVHLWRLTVFMSDTPAENILPAKKI